MNRTIILCLISLLLLLSACTSRYGYIPRVRLSTPHVQQKTEKRESPGRSQRINRDEIRQSVNKITKTNEIHAQPSDMIPERGGKSGMEPFRSFEITETMGKGKTRTFPSVIDTTSSGDESTRLAIKRQNTWKGVAFGGMVLINASLFFTTSVIPAVMLGVVGIIIVLSLFVLFLSENQHRQYEFDPGYRESTYEENGGMLLLAWLLVFASILLILFSVAIGEIAIFFLGFIALLVGLALFVSADRGGGSNNSRVRRYP